MSHYEALGVEPTADAADVRRAYVRLAREHHPDRHSGDARRLRLAEDRMREINAAWHVLSDPGRRAEYDRRLAEPNRSAHTRRGPMWEGGPTPGWRPFDDSDDDPSPEDLDDTPSGAWRPSAWLAMVPPFAVASAVLFGVLGLALGIRELFAFAVLAAGLGVFLFMLAPLRALSASRAADRLGGG